MRSTTASGLLRIVGLLDLADTLVFLILAETLLDEARFSLSLLHGKELLLSKGFRLHAPLLPAVLNANAFGDEVEAPIAYQEAPHSGLDHHRPLHRKLCP